MHTIPLQDTYTDDGPTLVARVEAEGMTRVLYISKDGSAEGALSLEKRHEELAKQRQLHLRHRNVYSQLYEEIEFHERAAAAAAAGAGASPSTLLLAPSSGSGLAPSLPPSLPLPHPTPALKVLNLAAVESAIGGLQDELGFTEPHIRERHHLLVEVKEAKGLRAGDISGLSDPFVQLGLKVNDTAALKRDGSYRQQRFTTYVVEKTLNPRWQNQLFIFRVPPEATANPKAYSICVKVKDFDGPVKKSDFLGQIDMQLDVLENEAELDGWYFLTPKPQLFQQSAQAAGDQSVSE